MAAPPPISNPANDQSGRLVASVATTTFLAASVVVSRICVRTCMVKAFGWDDGLIILTMATSLVGFSLVVVQAHHGAGRHRGDVDPVSYLYGMKINFVNQPIYLFAICFVKLAVGAALARIATVGSIYRRIIFGVMGFMLFYTIGCFFTIVFQCSDVRHVYDPTVPATCYSLITLRALSYTNAACNILTDLAFSLFIPVPMLWKLNINKRKKASLLCILALGVFACASAAVKVSYLPNYGKEGDFLWDSRNISIWTAAELNVGIIAGSLPSLKPLFKKVLGSSYGRGSRDQGNFEGRRYPRLSKSWQTLSGKRHKEPKLRSAGNNSSQIELSDTKNDSVMTSKGSISTNLRIEDELARQHSRPESDVSVGDLENGITRTIVTTIEYS